MKIPNWHSLGDGVHLSLARIVSEDSQPCVAGFGAGTKSSKDS